MQAGGSLALGTELANAEKKDSKITRNKNSEDYVRMHRKKYTTQTESRIHRPGV
jgi:hypothetical protein